MLYKCIFLYFLFIVKRYDGDNKLLCSGNKTKNPDWRVADRD